MAVSGLLCSLQHGQGQCINKDDLTDGIVEEMISRVANCKDQVQAVFLKLGLVRLCVCEYIMCMYVHTSSSANTCNVVRWR